MDGAANLIDSIAALLWPLVVVCLLWFLLPTLRSILGRSETINVEVAGTKVSVQRASEEVNKLISDLQDRVNGLESNSTRHALKTPAFERQPRADPTVLWVDDRVEANVYERARLQDAGYRIVQADSTIIALNSIHSRGPFEFIISDIARVEADGRLNPSAGLDLLRQLRQAGDLTPIVFYSSARSIERMRDELEEQRNTTYTASPSELMRLLGVSEVG